MSELLHTSLVASLMLTIAALVTGLVVGLMRGRGAHWRQVLFASVLLQGWMLVRVPVELPWLRSSTSSSAAMAGIEMTRAESNTLGVIPKFQVPDATGTPGIESQHAFATAARVVGGDEVDMTNRWATWLVVVWLAGWCWLAMMAVIRYWRVCRTTGQLDRASDGWSEEWRAMCTRRHLNAPAILWSDTMGPMLVRRPSDYVLVIPRSFWEGLSSRQRRGILLHELAHLVRRDVWRTMLVRLSASLHWWNPASWWCVRRFEESSEWACDDFVASTDPQAAQALASSFVDLLQFVQTRRSGRLVRPGLGVQSMAAPPLTLRVSRLLNPASNGDSPMKSICFALLAAGLLLFSAVQLRLVAATPDEIAGEGSAEQTGVEVLSPAIREQLDRLKNRLDVSDPNTAELVSLLNSPSGQIAVAGALESMEDRHRDLARAEAIPRFVQRHFDESSDGRLSLRDEFQTLGKDWVARGRDLDDMLERVRTSMQSVAAKIASDSDADRMALRMLTDEHAGLVITWDEFDGKLDPIDRFLADAFQDFLVRRGDRWVVVPSLSNEHLRHLRRIEQANLICERLKPELTYYASEYATPDVDHRRLKSKLETTAFAAMLAFDLAEDEFVSPAVAVETMIENLEAVSKDTPEGLVIEEEEAWDPIRVMLDRAERAVERLDDVRSRVAKYAEQMDSSDALSRRFATQLTSAATPYVIAAEIPYAEMDLAEHLEAMIEKVMVPFGEGQWKVRDDAAGEVIQRAGEVLSECRRIRRYVRQIEAITDRFADQQLAKQLGASGRLVMLADIRKSALRDDVNVLSILEDELLEPVDGTDGGQLTVRHDRADVIGELADRAAGLERELANDDF
ncbi:MAG: M56 family metallopeptidase [Planctomycetota bacterium]